jgi:CelD/BcsL family acetyltransferase involved in cellulose biosynthesis
VFEYVRNEYNPRPSLVLGPAPVPAGKLVCDLPYSTALSFVLPRSEEELRAVHGRKYWQTLRRKERRLQEDVLDVRFSVVADEMALRRALPRVQELFAERWAQEYTSFAWKTPDGFRPYAEAMTDLARQGRAELAVLEGDGRLLSFAYCLREEGTYYFYQHASTPDAQYRRYSVGKLLVAKLIEDLVRDQRCEVFDFMTGESDYKREWAGASRPILLRIEEDRTVVGAVRFAGRLVYRRTRLAVQFGDPRVRALAKRVLLALDRLRHRRSAGPTTSRRAAYETDLAMERS